MAKLKSDPIDGGDLEDFLHTQSDFDFEMRVLSVLQELEFECSHSGAYVDPVTGKIRQYDIRAMRTFPSHSLALAVECKNIRPNAPLLLSTVPRSKSESYNDLVVSDFVRPHQVRRVARTTERSPYREAQPVAKRTDQVGRLESSGELQSNDETTFEKLNQAVNSCRDLILQRPSVTSQRHSRAVVPVVVVPDGALWQVDYYATGALKEAPRKVADCPLWLDHAWSVADTSHPFPLVFHLSHLEFVTLGALLAAATEWLSVKGFFFEQKLSESL